MYVKELRRKCMVKGCRSMKAFSISRVREIGSGVIICSECLSRGSEAAKKYLEDNKDKKADKANSKPPSLFFVSHKADDTKEDKTGHEAHEADDTKEDKTSDKPNKNICKYCGVECKTNQGLLKHEEACRRK